MKKIDLKKQVLIWYRASFIVPVITTLLLAGAYILNVTNLLTLFIIACGLYFITAIVWWWWTMKSFQYLLNLLIKTSSDIELVSNEVNSIKRHFKKSND